MRYIDGNIYVLAAPVHLPPSSQPLTQPHGRASAIPCFADLPYIPTQSTMQSFLAMDNKEDTLTQSQMLKAPDSAAFIRAQTSEIRGLQDIKVFQYCPAHSLPNGAKLLSSI